MSARRSIVVKVRLSKDEADRLDANVRASGERSRADYLRRQALGAAIGTPEIADLVGRIGLALNAMEGVKPREIDRMGRWIDALAAALRTRSRSRS